MDIPICPICMKNKAVYDDENKWYRVCDSCISSKNSKKEHIHALKIDSGVPLDSINATLGCFIQEKVNALKIASRGFKTNLLFSGVSGVGKTYLLSAIIDYSISTYKKDNNPISVQFYNVFDLMQKINDYDEESKRVYNESRDRATDVDILVLDELMSSYTNRQYTWMYSVLNYRKENLKTTYFSTNVEVNDARLLSRMRCNDCIEVEVTKGIRK